MNLTEVYIHEVTRRLPEKTRKDIALELTSTIEDMLPEDYTEEDVKNALEKLGDPAILANNYLDRPMHLIGPRYFNIYVSLLKMILPIAGIISVISMVAESLFNYQGEEAILNIIIDIFSVGIYRLIEVGVQVFFWLTIIFAIIERVDSNKEQQPVTSSLEKWKPDDLKQIPYIPKEKTISKLTVYGALIWTTIWGTIYFNATHLVGVYNGTEEGLEFIMPSLNQEVLNSYWPLVIIMIALEIALAVYQLVIGIWTKKMALYNAILQIFATIVFIIILSNPQLLNIEFTSYMADLFHVTTHAFTYWLIGGSISIFILSAVYTVYEGYRKVK